MGMFDTINCQMPLPGFGGRTDDLQSKDLDCALDTYTITSDGRLIHHYREFEDTPEADLPDPARPYIGCMRVRAGSERLVDCNHHGWLHFHTYSDGQMWRWRAKFTDGKCVGIEQTEPVTKGA